MIVVVLSVGASQGEPAPGDPSDPDWYENRVVIAFHGPVPLDSEDWIAGLGGEVLLTNDVIHFVLAEFPTTKQARQAMTQALARGDVRHAEHEAVIHWDEPVEIVAVPTGTGALGDYTPNDPMWGDQWGPEAIDAPAAWDLLRGDHSTRLAIADTGITGSHGDLGANLCGPHISGSTDALAVSGHGTHVAGIAAATIDNGVGIAGLSQSCLMSIRVLGGGSAGLANGITFAADNGADAINMSFYTAENAVFRDALEYAYLEQDVVLVKSTGNGGCPGGASPTNFAAYASSHTQTWPAPEPSVIATSALAPPGTGLAGFSSCGNQLELAAPGQSILAPYLTGYAYLSGTSMAAPHVTGLVGLIRSANPDLTALEVRCVMALSADDLGTPGWDPFYGWGRINAHQAVLLAQEWDAGTLQQGGAPTSCVLPLTLA